MSFRNDPGRLSLETLLTGTALWLTFLYLMQEGAAAAGSINAQLGSGQPPDGDTGATAMDRTPIRTGSEGERRSLVAPEARFAEGQTPAAGSAVGDSPDSAAGGGGWSQAPVGHRVVPSPGLQDQGGAVPGTGSLAAGTLPLPWDASSGNSSERRSTGQGQGSDRPGVKEGTPVDVAAPPLAADPPVVVPAVESAPAVVPEVPGFRVLVRSSDSLVSRSVEGQAQASYHQSLGAITDAVIDLRDTPAPEVRVGSERDLQLLALSVLEDAELVVEISNTGLQRTSLLLGPEFNDIRVLVSDVIDLALMAGDLARGQIQQSLVGMQDSRLEDAGGGGALELSALAEVQLTASEAGSQLLLDVDLLAQAMQDSVVLLGNGDDRVTIDSGFRRGEGGNTLELRGRALGLVHSLLDAGGGDDQVSIATWLEQASPAALERIAMLESTIQLGEGDDLLSLQGAVIGSSIDPGGGTNAVRIVGAVRDSVLNLSADSNTSVGLVEHDDSLAVALPEDARATVDLQLGSGDDLILLPGAGLEGSVDGGAGLDTLRVPSVATPAPMSISLDGPGAGLIGRLGFEGIENLSLAAGDDRVSIGVKGILFGVLEAGGGLDRLDYAAWQEPVHVDLVKGLASGILGGIGGFEAVAGGSGNDWLIAAGETVELVGGDGDDQIDLDLSASVSAGTSDTAAWVIHGGGGRDRFVLSGMEVIRRMAYAGERALPVLADLDRSGPADGGIGLTDRLAWRRDGILVDKGGEEVLDELTPAGLEGIGQPSLLPIAPLDQLISGMATQTGGTDQLAIATGDLSSRLVLLGSDRSITAIADLPGFRTPPIGPDTVPVSGATPGAMA